MHFALCRLGGLPGSRETHDPWGGNQPAWASPRNWPHPALSTPLFRSPDAGQGHPESKSDHGVLEKVTKMTVRSAPKKGSTEFKVNKTFLSATACAPGAPRRGPAGSRPPTAQCPEVRRPSPAAGRSRQEVVSAWGAPHSDEPAPIRMHIPGQLRRGSGSGLGVGEESGPGVGARVGLLSGLLRPQSEFRGRQRCRARTSRLKAAAFHAVCTC